MRKLILGVLMLVAGCATAPGQTAAGIMGTYTLAATAAATYEGSPNADPKVVATIKACDAAAWVAVGPLAVALQAGQVPAVDLNAAAAAAVTALDGCLVANGVKVS